jgi:hypothetical protein
MDKIIATMYVKAELSSVRNAIAGYIRDGVIFRSSTYGTPGLTETLEMRECERLANEMRRVWTLGNCTILAEYRTRDLTALKLLAVKNIFYNNGAAEVDWRLVETEFKDEGLLHNSKSITRIDTGDVGTVLQERDLITKPRPKLEPQQVFKNEWREYFKVNPIINKGLPNQQTLNEEQIEKEVGEIWELHKQHVKELRTRWIEIHSFDKMATEKATKKYLGPNLQSKPATMRAESKRVDLQLKKPGRHPDPRYDEAKKRIDAGEDEKTVFEWFVSQEKITNPDKGTRDAFKAALSRRNELASK